MHGILGTVFGGETWCVSPVHWGPPSLGPVSFPCAYMLICLWVFLAKAGTQVVVPFRDEDEKRHLKVMGDLGQIVPLVCSRPHLRGIRCAYTHPFEFRRNGT